MAKRTLINRKTGAEFKSDNAEAMMKKHRGVFRLKPATEISSEVSRKEKQITEKVIEVEEPTKKKKVKQQNN